MNVFEEVQSLRFPKDAYVVLGSAVLAAHGVREARDIDILVRSSLFDALRKKPDWKEDPQESGRLGLANGRFFVMTNWPINYPADEEGWTLDDFGPFTSEVEGIPFLDLSFMRDWKASVMRPKDLEDVHLIDRHVRHVQEAQSA